MKDVIHEDRTFPSHPRVGVGVVLLRGDRVLLVKRGSEPAKGEWSVPGGLIDVGETVEQAAHRELYEECGVTADIIKVIDIFEFIEPGENHKIKYHFIVIEILARYVGGRVRAASDAADAKWLRLDDLESVQCSNKIKKLVRKALAEQV